MATRYKTRNGASPVVDALSVDVEDCFQVESFAHRVPRETWHTYRGKIRTRMRPGSPRRCGGAPHEVRVMP